MGPSEQKAAQTALVKVFKGQKKVIKKKVQHPFGN